MKNVWVLFVGQVRNHQGFLQKIERLKTLKKTGEISGIVYSTWIGEVDKYEGLRSIIEKTFDALIETVEPKLRVPGHMMHQMQAIHFGLQACPPDSHILKLRPDLGAIDPMLPAIRGEIDTRLDIGTKIPSKFSEKIVIITGFTFLPLYINDIIFFGLKKDIEKLIHFDISGQIIYNLSPEQMFFSNFYLDQFPILSTYFRAQHGLIFGNPDLSARLNGILVDSDFWMEMFSLYVFILDRDFRFYVPGEVQPDRLKDVPYGGLFAPVPDCPGIRLERNAHSPLFDGELCVKGLIEGWFASDRFGERFQEALEKLRQPAFHTAWRDEAHTADVGVRALESRLRAESEHYRTKLLAPVAESDGVTWRLDYMFSDLHIPHDESAVIHLENEINYLRRLNDDLNRKLVSLKTAH